MTGGYLHVTFNFYGNSKRGNNSIGFFFGGGVKIEFNNSPQILINQGAFKIMQQCLKPISHVKQIIIYFIHVNKMFLSFNS